MDSRNLGLLLDDLGDFRPDVKRGEFKKMVHRMLVINRCLCLNFLPREINHETGDMGDFSLEFQHEKSGDWDDPSGFSWTSRSSFSGAESWRMSRRISGDVGRLRLS